MIVARIRGATRTLGKTQGFIGLPIRDEKVIMNGHVVNVMESMWEPTPAELELLKQGGKVMLTLMGDQHPPVRLDVSVPPPVEPQEGGAP